MTDRSPGLQYKDYPIPQEPIKTTPIGGHSFFILTNPLKERSPKLIKLKMKSSVILGLILVVVWTAAG